MQLSNDEMKLISDKYDPQGKGRIYYESFCEDYRSSANTVDNDLNSLLAELYQIIRTKFNTFDEFFKKFDQAQKGSLNLRDFTTLMDDYNISPSRQILTKLHQKIDPDNKGTAIYIRISITFL